MREYNLDENGRPRVKLPSMAEYAMAKKEMECGVDPASKEGDTTVYVVLDRDMTTQLYWATLPKEQKKKISVKYK